MFRSPVVAIFREVFLQGKLNSTHRYNKWITRGIKVSCHNKRILYMSCRESNDTNLQLQYERYCTILTNNIKTHTKKYYDKLISKSKNKTKMAVKQIKKK